MNFKELVSKAPATVLSPDDIVILSIDRFLSKEQLAEMEGYWQKRLPNNRVIVIQTGMSIEVIQAAASVEVALPA